MQSTDELVPSVVKSTLGKYYKKVFYVGNGDWFPAKKLFDKFKSFDIQNHVKHKYEKTAVIIYHGEPFYYTPGSDVPLQAVNILDIINKCSIFSTDFFILGYHDAEKGIVKFLNENLNHFHNKFYHIPIDNFHHFNDLIPEEKEMNLQKVKYNFSYLGYNHRMHRILFSKFLIKEQLYKNNLVSFSTRKNYHIKEDTKEKEDLIGIPTYNRDHWAYDNEILDLFDSAELFDYTHPEVDNSKPDNNPIQGFIKKACVHVVSETIFNYPFPNFNEKMIQAINAKRPFVILGPAGSLQRLKSLGYRTFPTVIDESYDQIQNPNDRLKKVITCVKELAGRDIEDLKTQINSIKDVLDHNYELFYQKRKGLRKTLESSIISICQ